MELSPSQRKRLRTAIIAAYPRHPNLELMVEDELDEDLNHITQGQTIYDLEVKDLIKWAEAQGKVRELVLGASRSNPGNSQLQQFIGDEIGVLLDEDYGPITEQLTQELWQALELFDDFGPVLKAGLATLPDDSADARREDIVNLKDAALSRDVKTYIVLRLLLQDYPQRRGTPSILAFAHELQSYCRDIQQQRLQEWIKAVEQHCNLEGVSQFTPSSSTSRDSVDAYLMIVVEPQKGKKDQYRLKSSIHLYEVSDNPQLLEEIPLDISDDPSVKGVVCSFGEVRQKVAVCILKTGEKLFQSRRREELSYRKYDLTVEIFLPFSLLGETVDLWEVADELGDGIPLGRKYRLSLRSYDRLRGDLLNQLWIAWDRFIALLAEQSSQPCAKAHFEHVNSLEDPAWEALEVSLTSKVGLKMVCPPPDAAADRDKFFKTIIRGSVPLALWTRCSRLEGCDNWETILDRFITWDLLKNVSQMLETVKTERMKAYAAGDNARQCLGYHLSVMCDDPNRLPSPLEPLSEYPDP